MGFSRNCGHVVHRGGVPSILNFYFSQIQPPSPSSPVPTLFLPSDPPLAWLLAKIWVRSSDFQLQELQFHLLNTHLVAEVIAVATMRCLPGLHPIFKVQTPPSVPSPLEPK